MFDDNLIERFELASERIKEIKTAGGACSDGRFSDYFCKMSELIISMTELFGKVKNNEFEDYTFNQLSEFNKSLYEDILEKNYDKSYANPVYAVKVMGLEYGRMLSFLYVELRGMIAYAYELRIAEMTVLMELFVEIYCSFESETPDSTSLRDIIYWYVSDYSDDFVEYRVREQIDTSLSFATDIIMNENLDDIRYLYKFGEYITDNEIMTATYLNSLPDEKISAMAHTFTEGYRKGFELTGKDISRKKTVNIRYCLGFERLVREEIKQFEEIGLKTTIYRAAVNTINKRMHIKIGYYGTSPNKQMEYDHRFDNGIYLDAAFIERKLGALKFAYEKNKEKASVFGGPAVMEVFGEEPFEPENRTECMTLDDKQRALSVKYDRESSEIVNNYIKGEERSFTIIAYPIPEIGKDYEKIFDETVKINTLDYDVYCKIQKNIIDALDKADYVEVKGMNGNKTDICVNLMKKTNTEKQTVFENCLADVNIPLGEVFTSPVLAKTNGVINVSEVYLNDLKFKNLSVTLKDGMVADYTCDNFADEEKNREFFKENVLYNHETLPIGEFAIGTNTTAYVMANKYDIVYKLPILIVEKMGPHFALGDTCYSRAEDIKVYNPDGKEIISKENEISSLRKTQPEKAYFNCHTDITIPYEEIGSITAVEIDGKRIDIIRNGRFVLEGCEELNRPFEK